jgi:glycine betaine/proline transport system substrate-binding protein
MRDRGTLLLGIACFDRDARTGETTLNRRAFMQALAGTAAGAWLIAACGSDDKASPAGTAAAGTDDTAAASAGGGTAKIVLVKNAWTASAIDAEIAKQLIEKNLGNPVEVTAIDENTQYDGLASGKLDAVLEVWPSGLSSDEQKYFDNGSVANLGELGAVGRIGWYVPRYVLDAFPAVKTWEGLKAPKTAAAFSSAETGDKGRFLGTDPSYSQADEPIIKNLELPFQVVYSGSEAATVAELDGAVAAKKPVLLYWWTPTAATAKYDLVEVELPKYTDGCRAVDADIACAYPEDVLFKAASAKLKEKDAKVWAFLEKFTLTNEQQLALLPSVEIDKKDVAEVAAGWIADNEAIWKAWL